MDGSHVSRAGKTAERNTLLMHPDDARARGITEGSIARAYNDRGACLVGVRITTDITPGVVALPTGAWFDPLPGDEQLDVHGNPNALTPDVGTSRMGQGCAAQSCLVEVARWEGDAPPIRAFEPSVG
jgi:biotin/methionine sulfoxide reductase